MPITEFFAGIAVADFAAMRAWYERLMDRPPDFSPQDGEVVWRVTEHAWIYVVATRHDGAAGRAGMALLTILVDDLAQQVAQVAARGLPIGPITADPGGVRKAVLSDPEGNRITFSQPLP
jgi:catechol 2,3-dioxygenase-like lactoylglutathione lyase family enzyme